MNKVHSGRNEIEIGDISRFESKYLNRNETLNLRSNENEKVTDYFRNSVIEAK